MNKELTDQLVRIGQVLRLGYVIPYFRLYDGLGLEEQPCLSVLQNHLQQMADMQRAQTPMAGRPIQVKVEGVVLVFVQTGDVEHHQRLQHGADFA